MIKKILISIIISIIIIYLAIGAILTYKQSSFLYFPRTNTNHNYKDVFLKNEDCKLQIIVVNEGKRDAILYFGGNAETISKSAEYISKQFPEHTSYMMNYRGFGLSSCKSTEKGLYSDSVALYDYVKKEHKEISVGGRSLGTGIATYLTSKRDVNKLVLITPYDSILSVAQERYPMYPVNLLLNEKYLSINNVKKFKTKTLLAIAENDTVVSREHSNKLFKMFPKDQAKIILIKNTDHINISKSEKYFYKIREFIMKEL